MAAAVGGWDALLAGLRAITGGARGLVYDVPRHEAPAPRDAAQVYVSGGPTWWSFVHRRRQLDDGVLTPVVALRPLGPEERALVTGWGSRFANSLLVIEPIDPGCDLTDPRNARRDGLLRLAERTPVPARTPLAAALRAVYGVWNSATDGQVPVQPGGPDETLMGLILDRLRARYPVQAYVDALVSLVRDEPELFTGRPAGRVVLPFLTRRGLPMVHDPALVTEAVRLLVNRGVIRVSARVSGMSYRGPVRPVPESISRDAFEALLLS